MELLLIFATASASRRVISPLHCLHHQNGLIVHLFVDKRIVELNYVRVLYLLHLLNFVQHRLDVLLFVDVRNLYFLDGNFSGEA